MLHLVPSLSHSEREDGATLPTTPTPTDRVTLDEWTKNIHTQMRTLQPNRMVYVDAGVTSSKGVASVLLAVPAQSPRYSIWVLDVDSLAHPKAAVLVLPQGRESEWQFRSMTGGKELATQNGFSRVVFVALNRGQIFTGLDQVKQELTPLLRAFQPSAMVGSMPIVSLGSDVGARREVYRSASAGASAASSSPAANAEPCLVVEDVLVESHVHRRLVFGSSGLVQSEARLNVSPAFLTMTAAQRKAKAKKKKANAKKKSAASVAGAVESKDDADGGEDGGEDGDEAESASSNAAAASSSVAAASSIVPSCAPSPSAALIQWNFLPCEYQHGLVACLALLPQSIQHMVLIGLGGGSLAMFLHFAFPTLSLHVVELDPAVLDSAWRFFGFRQDWGNVTVNTAGVNSGKLICHVEDGLTFVDNLADRVSSNGVVDAATAEVEKLNLSPASSSSLPSPPLPTRKQDVILLDVNNTDLVDGLSFPPPAFLALSFLQRIVSSLTPDGWLLLNLGCRNEPLREQLLSQIAEKFKNVFVLRPDVEHVNFIISATNGELTSHQLDWSQTSARLNKMQQPVPAAPGRSAFTWDKSMAEDVTSVLKKVQHLSVQKEANRTGVQLKSLFPAQLAEEEANRK